MTKVVKLTVHFWKKLPAAEKRITVPTVLTVIRLVFAPVIVGAMIAQSWGLAFWLFLCAAATDALDGGLARLFNQQTFLGACLDPIADKLLVLSVFSTLAFFQSPLFSIPFWFVLTVLIKETIIIAGSIGLVVLKGHFEARPTRFGKLLMLGQMSFIIWLFACYFFQWVPIKTYYTMLSSLLVLILLSLGQYVTIGIRQVRS